ncbi:neuronal regeneration-related protein [Amazona ochrocephala]
MVTADEYSIMLSSTHYEIISCGHYIPFNEVYQPRVMIWVSQKIFPTSRVDGGFPKGSLPISKEVNRKKKSEAEGASLIPVNGYGHHFTKIKYLCSF